MGSWELFLTSDRVSVSDKTMCELNRIECLAVEGDGPVGGSALSLESCPK